MRPTQGVGAYSAGDYTNEMDRASDNYNPAYAGNYVNEMDRASDNYNPASEYGYRNGSDIQSDGYGYTGGQDWANDVAGRKAASNPMGLPMVGRSNPGYAAGRITGSVSATLGGDNLLIGEFRRLNPGVDVNNVRADRDYNIPTSVADRDVANANFQAVARGWKATAQAQAASNAAASNNDPFYGHEGRGLAAPTSYANGLSAQERWNYATSLNAATSGEKVGVFLSNSFGSGAQETLKAGSAFINDPVGTSANVLSAAAGFAADLFGSAGGDTNSQLGLRRRLDTVGTWFGKVQTQWDAGDYGNMGTSIPLLPPVISGRAVQSLLDSSAGGVSRALPGDAGHFGANTVTPGGTGTALTGHGGKFLDSPPFVVPEGSAVTLPRPNINILDRTGQFIEKGDWEGLSALARTNPRVANDIEGMTTWLPGAEVPGYTLFQPDKGINLFSRSHSVYQPTPLQQILEPNLGCIQWAACTSFLPYTKP